jgi:TP901 family phage tail tape measure protein
VSDQVLTRPVVEILGDDNDLQATLERAAGTMRAAGEQMQRIGATLSAALTVPIAAIGLVSTKAAIQFESSFAGIRKTMDLTEAEFQRLSDANRELSRQIPVSANELNKIGELAGQLGIRGVDNVLKFEDTIAKLAVTTDLTSEQGALAFAQIANVMQLPQNEIDRLGAVVVGLGNNFATVESQIVEFTKRIAGAGALANLTVGSVAGIGTAFASLGIEAEAGGTAVQKVIVGMLTAVQTGGKELEIFASTLGVTAAEFAAAFQADAGETFVDFVEALGTQGNAAIVTLEALGLTDQRLTRSFLAAAGAGDLLRNAMAKGNLEFEKNTALQDEAAKRFATSESRLTILRNRIEFTAVTIGNALVPIMMRLLDVMGPVLALVDALAVAFGSLPMPVQLFAVTVASLLAVLGPALLLLGSLATVAPAFTAGYTMMTGAVGRLVTALTLQRTVTLAGVIPSLTAMRGAMAGLAASNVVKWASEWLWNLRMMTPATFAQVAATSALTSATAALRAVVASIVPALALLVGAVAFTAYHWDVLRYQAALAFEAVKQIVLSGVGFILRSLEKLLGWVPMVGESFVQLRKDFDAFALTSVAKGNENIHAATMALSAAGAAADGLTEAVGKIPPIVIPDVPDLTVPTLNVGGTGDGESKADAVKQAFESLNATLGANITLQSVLGAAFDKSEADAAALRTAIDALALAGVGVNDTVGPQRTSIAKLSAEYTALTTAIGKTAETQRYYQAMTAAGAAMTEKFATPLDVLNNSLFEINELFDLGVIGWETYQAAMKAAYKTFDEAPARLAPVGSAMSRIAQQGIDAFAGFATGAKNAISDFVSYALRELAKLLIKLAAVRLLSTIFPGSADLIGSLAGISKRAAGGPVRPNRPYWVGERGPELIVPAAAGNVVANHNLGGGVIGLDLSSLPERPRVVTPDALALDDWWRTAFSALNRDAQFRGAR